MGDLPWWERLGVPHTLAEQRQVPERRVLVLSHNAFLRRVVGDLLSLRGTRVESRASAEQAVDRPVADLDLVLAEHQLPGASGLWLLREIRTGRTGFPTDVPFVFMVETAERWLVEAALNLDAGGCLLLPLNARKIEEAMELALAREPLMPGPGHYAEVSLEPPVDVAGAAQAPEPVPAALPGCFARMMPGAHLVPVEELVPGMRLGADLLSERGLVLLALQTGLDAAGVERLRAAAGAFGFSAVPILGGGGEGAG